MRFCFYTILALFFIGNKLLLSSEDLGKVVASPNKSLLQLDKTGASILLIEKKQIQNSASTSVSGLLQEFGGFSIATKGNKGSDPSYFNRGLARKYLKVLVDGMDLSDITSTQEEPTYIDNIIRNNIDNIEILNGSQGTMYGGGAVGGVISLSSSMPDKIGFNQEHFIEGGSYGTVKNSHSFKFLNKKVSLVFNIDSEKSSGYNSFIDTSLAHFEKDGYYLYGTNFLSNFKINQNLELNLRVRSYYQHNEYDDNYSYPGDSLLHYRYDKAKALLLDILYSNNNFNHKFTFQPTYTTRINASSYGRYEYDGRKNKLEYLVSSNFWGINSLLGIDYLKKNANMNGTLADHDIYSFFTEFKLKPTKNINLDISGRREYDNNYGEFDSGRLQVNYSLLNNTILRASLGSGYRTPTPYELYSTYGDTNLKPETSLTYDLGSEFNFKKVSTNFYLGIFETKVEDIITYSSSKYRQTSSNLKSYGLEARLKSIVSNKTIVGINYTKTNAKENDGDNITLVPKDKIILFLDLLPLENLNFNTSFQFQNKAKDTKYNELPVYKSLNLSANYLINNNSKAFLKIENLIDRKNIVNRGGGTSENLGYKSPDISFYLGFKFTN